MIYLSQLGGRTGDSLVIPVWGLQPQFLVYFRSQYLQKIDKCVFTYQSVTRISPSFCHRCILCVLMKPARQPAVANDFLYLQAILEIDGKKGKAHGRS